MEQTNAQELDQEHYLQVYKRHPITLLQGAGAKVKDQQGNIFIDALAGVAVNSVGHCHPRVVSAIQDQAEKLIHISNFYVSPAQSALAEKLTDLSGLDRIFLSNSGAEAVEAGIKLARNYGNKNGKGGKIISMEGCFHGRSLGTIAAGKKAHQEGFEPIPQGYEQVPFNDSAALRKAIDEETCAVILEPVQGEGGIIPAEKEYLQKVREICDEKGVLLILDEVQCGLGRTGSFFAFQEYGIEPDVLCLAKALGGGVPIGATLCKEEVAKEMAFGQHGSTFGGNPLASAAALATIEAIEAEDLTDRAKELGVKAMAKLREELSGVDAVKDIRGAGLMIGVELSGKAKEVLGVMIENNVLGNVTGGEVLRLVPPLVIEEEDLATVLNVMCDAIKRIHGE